jgi:hypothetical protein
VSSDNAAVVDTQAIEKTYKMGDVKVHALRGAPCASGRVSSSR